ncbi:epoxide hydrolase family protein [Ottowia sp.]|uniref:epoxide hydrolase family protein n=1 Tax=Ottowia sp. TaxID=1898956 RepID=UPI0039E3C6FA
MTDGILPAEPIHVPEEVLADLRARLRAVRWPDELPDTGGVWGPGVDRMKRLCARWADGYDWGATEARVNQWPQYRTVIDGQDIHFFWLRSTEPNPIPLLLTHGWPGSVMEFLEVAAPLVAPGEHGAAGRPTFDLVIPSLPGYGWSAPPRARGWTLSRVARAWAALMARLGYDRFGAQGGDLGAMVSARLALHAPERMLGLHLTMAVVPHATGEITAQEQADLDDVARFVKYGTTYQATHCLSSQTVGYALNDSPAGLAAWILDKFDRWTDSPQDAFAAVPLDRVLDNLTLYWVTGTIASSMRLYAESRLADDLGPTRGRVEVPTGVALYPREIYRFPRSWIEAAFNLVHYRRMARGGHFAAMEEPDLFVADVRDFFGRLLRPA